MADELVQERSCFEVVDALVTAVDDAYSVLDVLLSAADGSDAVRALKVAFAFNDVQAQAVMDMQLRRVTIDEARSIRERQAELAR